MPRNDDARIALANSTLADLASETTLSPLQARAFVRCVQKTWEVESIRWGKNDSQKTFEQAKRLIHAAKILLTVEGGSVGDAVLAFRRAAELLEWLARSNDNLKTLFPTALLAAGCYQLGGLPAMASGLLRQVPQNDRGSLLFSKFLKGDFDGALHEASRFWKDNIDLTIPGLDETLFEEVATSNNSAWLCTVELVRCIGLASYSLRRGNETRFTAAYERLKDIEALLLRTSSSDIALLSYFLRAACERFGKASIYHPLKQLARLNPARSHDALLFARRQFSRGRGILWESQQKGIDRLLHNSSFALCTPTGSGKTLVATLSIFKELLIVQEDLIVPLALYLVPSRALAGEIETKLRTELGREFLVTGLYGGSDWGITDAWLTSDTPTVLIATVEKAEALLRYLGATLLARLKLLIVDEAHQVVIEDNERERETLAEHGNRAIRHESFISRLLAKKSNIVRVALTAVAGGAAHPVAQWIETNQDGEPIGSKYRSTRQAIGVLEIGNGPPRIQLDRVNDHSLTVRGQDSVYIPLNIEPMPEPPAIVRNVLNRFTQISILWTALHLTAGDRRILISITQRPEHTLSWFAHALSLPGWAEALTFEPPEAGEDADLFSEARLVCIDYCGADSHELALLDRGIATNHGQMPQRLRRMMVALIERSICKITVATATLTEGVNLPFDIIFLPSLKRTAFDAVRRRQNEYPLSTAEFRNLAGRAGRPGASKGMEGLALVALPQSISTTAPGIRREQRGQLQDRHNEYSDLLQRLAADTTREVISPLGLLLNIIREKALNLLGIANEDEFLAWLEDITPDQISILAGQEDPSDAARFADSLDELDGLLLAAIEEAKSVDGRALTVGEAEETLSTLWQKTFTIVSDTYESWMQDAFIQRGQGLIANVYPDENERARLYDYGYSPHIGRRFENAATEIKEILDGCVNYSALDERERFEIFVELGNVIVADKGYGFSVRDTVTARQLHDNWTDVLAWWMILPDATSPEPIELRAWQMFVSDNLEFRLGVAIGAVVARAWSNGVNDPLDTPTLETWKEVTGLSWFSFWAKELLRWGTLEPFVAFALSQGIAKTRAEAGVLRQSFIAWLAQATEENATNEDLIDPRKMLEWSRSLRQVETNLTGRGDIPVTLSGTTGANRKYPVIFLRDRNQLRWIDSAGFTLALSEIPEGFPTLANQIHDYDLHVQGDRAFVRKEY